MIPFYELRERTARRDRLRRLAWWCVVAVAVAVLVFSGPSDAAIVGWSA